LTGRPTVRIAHLYPDLMNLYGDRGNVIALRRRCEWHGLAPEVRAVGLGESGDLTSFDIIFIGGGQDREQRLICLDFVKVKGAALAEAVADGVTVLAICGGYQLLGAYYRTAEGEEMPGIGLLDAWTVAGRRRMIGNVVVESGLAATGGRRTIVGFENHSGQTYLGPGVAALGRVLTGHGNNGADGLEGATYRNVVGTYLHGSLLPKNPALTDHLIRTALRRRYGPVELAPLDDAVELAAHDAAVRRAGATGFLPV
jgi:CobQ-like glutamine amidotransferase family enzyme